MPLVPSKSGYGNRIAEKKTLAFLGSAEKRHGALRARDVACGCDIAARPIEVAHIAVRETAHSVEFG
jgi:hypothetical protein